ncbi:fibronectin type III domain-containing protein [Lactobacillus rhamnosus]|uniref:Fibronectin type III domain-containing protein n=1 Tax=Lacticaseibacillus rhamnosus TaxID=47715 RepID=A0A7Y7QGW9_LACRH|nr:fibronectin type III domain-containing protein [Lacticaseibacillus rhamnosus]NVO88952.1 fibronectin type III domain-containing protein [Lacticaseibacillus rhamnosus]
MADDSQTVDRSNAYLKALKGGNVVAVGDKGSGQVAITGLAAGTATKDGDYKVAFDDTDQPSLSGDASDTADVPAFTVPVPGPTAVPAAPTVKLTAGDKKIDYVVTPATSEKSDQVTGYKVQLKASSDDWSKATVKTDLTGTFDNLTDGTEYTVGVVATNAKGDSDINATGASDHATPVAPTK